MLLGNGQSPSESSLVDERSMLSLSSDDKSDGTRSGISSTRRASFFVVTISFCDLSSSWVMISLSVMVSSHSTSTSLALLVLVLAFSKTGFWWRPSFCFVNFKLVKVDTIKTTKVANKECPKNPENMRRTMASNT
ncbi:hypothetical protein Sjap_003819 [Stephania japonica]|uniref:Uncharacterized protein n=1 Tax=Stephania japonica TaxID=461633 RepID=A0AAP0PVV4_9MAGN